MANAMREAADRAAARNASTNERGSSEADATVLPWPDRTVLTMRGAYVIVLRGRVHLATSEHGDPRLQAFQRVLAVQIAGGADRVVVLSESQNAFLVRGRFIGRPLTFGELQSLVAGDNVNPNAIRFTLTGRRDSMEERARRARANQASTSQRGGLEGLGEAGSAMRRAADRAAANQNSTNQRGDSEELTEGRIVRVGHDLGVYRYGTLRPILTEDIERSRADEAVWRQQTAVAHANQSGGILEITPAEARTAGIGATLTVGEVQELFGGDSFMRWKADRAAGRNASTGQQAESFTVAPRAVPYLSAARAAGVRAMEAALLARKHAAEAKGKVAQARRADAARLVGESVRLRQEAFVAGDEMLRAQGVATQLLAAADLHSQAQEMRNLANRPGLGIGKAQSLSSRAMILDHKATQLERASEALQKTRPAQIPRELDAQWAAKAAGKVNARLVEAQTRGLKGTVTLEGLDVFSGLPFAGIHGNGPLGYTLSACECGAPGQIVQGLAALEDQFNAVMGELAGEHASYRVRMGGVSSVEAIGALSATIGIGFGDQVRAAQQAAKQKAMERAAAGSNQIGKASIGIGGKRGFGVPGKAAPAPLSPKASAAILAPATPAGTKKRAPPPPIVNKAGVYQGQNPPPPGADPYAAGGGSDAGGAGGDAPYVDPEAPASEGGGFPVVPVVGGLLVLGGLAAFLMSRKKAA
jgi:hypothetical protein